MNKNTKNLIGLILAGSIASGSVVVDNLFITDAEVKASIEQAIQTGKVPLIDISKVDLDRVSSAYLEIAQENGIDLEEVAGKGGNKNVYELVREKKQKKGEVLSPVTAETLEVK